MVMVMVMVIVMVALARVCTPARPNGTDNCRNVVSRSDLDQKIFLAVVEGSLGHWDMLPVVTVERLSIVKMMILEAICLG
jgi:hypothetical protein